MLFSVSGVGTWMEVKDGYSRILPRAGPRFPQGWVVGFRPCKRLKYRVYQRRLPEKVLALDNGSDEENFWESQPPVLIKYKKNRKGKLKVETSKRNEIAYKKRRFLMECMENEQVPTATWTISNCENRFIHIPHVEFFREDYLLNGPLAAKIISAVNKYKRPEVYRTQADNDKVNSWINQSPSAQNNVQRLQQRCHTRGCLKPFVLQIGNSKKCGTCLYILHMKAVLATHPASHHCGMKDDPGEMARLIQSAIVGEDSIFQFCARFHGDHSTVEKMQGINNKVDKLSNIHIPTEFLQECILGDVQFVNPSLHSKKTYEDGDTCLSKHASVEKWHSQLPATTLYRSSINVSELEDLTSFVQNQIYDFQKYLYWVVKHWEAKANMQDHIDTMLRTNQILQLRPSADLLALFNATYPQEVTAAATEDNNGGNTAAAAAMLQMASSGTGV